MYKGLQEALMEARIEKDSFRSSNLIGVIDAVDKKVFEERKKHGGDDFVPSDESVVAVIKNQVKNIKLALEKAPAGELEAIQSMEDSIGLLSSFLPPKVEGDDLRMIIQGLGAKNMGMAMGMLKKASIEQGFDFDGKEASVIAKDVFL